MGELGFLVDCGRMMTYLCLVIFETLSRHVNRIPFTSEFTDVKSTF